MKVHGLVTCRNRRDATIRSVGQLCQQFQDLGIEFSLTLVDDGSTDGTATAVSEFLQGDDDELLQGDGNLYWAVGMRYGWEHSAKLKDFDYLLIFNDDINLYENALASLIEDLVALRVHNHKLILVAPFYDNDGMSISYSGY